MTDDWLKSMDDGKLVGAVLLDFSAAFDVIDHELLLGKLKCYGFKDAALSWMESYLSRRRQKVFFNGSFSNSKDIHCGVPQGSCLGPLLYSIFTNDLPSVMNKARVVMYADDSTIYSAASECNELTNVLSSELRMVSEWVDMNKLVLNISKTKCIVFGSRYMLADDPLLNLAINRIHVEQVKKTKLLGVILDTALSWSEHIDNIVIKMGKGIAVTRKCSEYVTSSTLNQVIQSLVFSHLEYCPAIWSSAAKKDIKKLQMAQNRAARLSLHCSNRMNIIKMHQNLSWLHVKNKLLSSLLIFFRNVTFFKKPQYLSVQLVHTSNTHNHQTRQANSGQLKQLKPRTNCLKSAVLYRAIAEWNLLPIHISQAKSKSTFKKKIKEHLM
uniref:Reverse transcriptase domain-containing protein n=1 Tax=Hucho hucho TaxID=62062 RepID=A0A4W5P3U4_9TELE